MIIILGVVLFMKGVVVGGMAVVCEAVAVGFVVFVWVVVCGFAGVDGGMVVIFMNVGSCVVDLAVDGVVLVVVGVLVVVVWVAVVVESVVVVFSLLVVAGMVEIVV